MVKKVLPPKTTQWLSGHPVYIYTPLWARWIFLDTIPEYREKKQHHCLQYCLQHDITEVETEVW